MTSTSTWCECIGCHLHSEAEGCPSDWQVRDYLEMEFRPKSSEAQLPFGFDLERIIDDFVLFCMLIGNDFLPCAHRSVSIASGPLLQRGRAGL